MEGSDETPSQCSSVVRDQAHWPCDVSRTNFVSQNLNFLTCKMEMEIKCE